VRDADTPEALGPGHAAIEKPMAPSPYWGEEKIWDTKANTTTACSTKRVGSGSRRRCAAQQPGLLQEGLGPSLGQAVPLERTNRALTFLDPKTKKYTFVDTCFQTHHLQFGYDAKRHGVDQRRRPGGRLGQQQDVRRDGRRGQVAGLDGRSSSTPTATASAMSTSSPTSRSIRPRTSASAAASMR